LRTKAPRTSTLRGILASAVGPASIRLVTLLDVDSAACVAAAAALTEEIEAL
jgi:hypothetical protein